MSGAIIGEGAKITRAIVGEGARIATLLLTERMKFKVIGYNEVVGVPNED